MPGPRAYVYSAQFVYAGKTTAELRVPTGHLGRCRPAATEGAKMSDRSLSFVKSNWYNMDTDLGLARTSVHHALRIGQDSTLDPEVTCPRTWAIFGWFEKLKSFLPQAHHVLVAEAVHNVIIYMGHVVRTEVQQRRITTKGKVRGVSNQLSASIPVWK